MRRCCICNLTLVIRHITCREAILDATGTESPIGNMCAADVEELNALHLMVSDTSAEYQLRYAEVRSSV